MSASNSHHASSAGLEDQKQGKQHDLEARRGSLLPDLPPEILAAIFLLIPRDVGDTSWIRVTHVCHRWREVALNDPRFWSVLNSVPPCFMEFALARSKGAPISVHTSEDTPDDTLFKALSPDRLQEVSLNLTAGGRTVLSHFTKSFPILETVEIFGDVSESWFMPKNFLSESRHLKHLLLDNWRSFTWGRLPQAAQCGTLLTLSLNVHVDAEGVLSPETFLQCMGRMPLLQILELEYALPSTQEDFATSSSPFQPVVLQHLRELSLKDHVLVSWYDFLTCPNLTHLRLDQPAMRVWDSERPRPEAFFRSLKQMPLLQDMTFTGIGFLPISESTNNLVCEPVLLRHLTCLELQDRLPALVEYFNMVQHPGQPSMQLHICRCEAPRPCAQAFEKFLWSLRNSLDDVSNPMRTPLGVECLAIPGDELAFQLASHPGPWGTSTGFISISYIGFSSWHHWDNIDRSLLINTPWTS